MLRNSDKYPFIRVLRKYNLAIAQKAETLNHALPAISLWNVVIIIESVIAIFALLMFLVVIAFALVCLVVAFFAAIIALAFKAAGYPSFYNALWVSSLKSDLADHLSP